MMIPKNINLITPKNKNFNAVLDSFKIDERADLTKHYEKYKLVLSDIETSLSEKIHSKAFVTENFTRISKSCAVTTDVLTEKEKFINHSSFLKIDNNKLKESYELITEHIPGISSQVSNKFAINGLHMQDKVTQKYFGSIYKSILDGKFNPDQPINNLEFFSHWVQKITCDCSTIETLIEFKKLYHFSEISYNATVFILEPKIAILVTTLSYLNASNILYYNSNFKILLSHCMEETRLKLSLLPVEVKWNVQSAIGNIERKHMLFGVYAIIIGGVVIFSGGSTDAQSALSLQPTEPLPPESVPTLIIPEAYKKMVTDILRNISNVIGASLSSLSGGFFQGMLEGWVTTASGTADMIKDIAKEK